MENNIKTDINENEYQIRSLVSDFKVDLGETGRTLSGYAIRFNERSRFIGWYETISPTAVTQEVLDNSDIFVRYNHKFDNFLARSNKGKGSLHLELRQDGVFFEFECPDTAFGNDILTKIKRGEITECSFGFFLSKDKDAITRSTVGDTTYITINKIRNIFDISVCDTGVYSTTSVNLRSLDVLNEIDKKVEENKVTILNNMEDTNEKNLRSIEEEEEKKEETEEVKTEETQEQEETQETEQLPDNDEETEEKKEESVEDKEEQTEDVKSEEEDKEEKRSISDNIDNNKSIDNNKNINHNIMNTNFSITRAIKNAISHNGQDELTQAVINAGQAELRSCNISDYAKPDIVIPMQTRAVQVTGEDGVHDHVIETDFLSIMEPLTANNILADLGVNMMTGLVKDLQIPSGSAITATWEGETDTTPDSAAIFSHKTMRPHRLGVVVPISIQMLEQDSLGVENYVRRRIIEAIRNKVQATFFSNDAATDNIPGGVFNANNSTAGAENVDTFKKLVLNEALIKANDYNGDNIKYAAAPKATAALRSLSYGGKSTAMVLQNNSVDGKPLFETTAVGSAGEYVVGDWSTVIVGQWGPLVISLDDKSLIHKGLVRLVVNSYWDICFTRPEALVRGSLSLA